ncbi:MAG: hypothetical protein KGM99_14865, partial [Burkholderiales bacterium]|nr:hypothetical protein [Burkholderiales bacterium]
KDASGKAFVSDRPIPECANRAMRVRKENGSEQRVIPPPLTAEEKQKLDKEKEEQKQAAILEEKKKREERYLLARYHDESDIETMRQKSLTVAKEKIRAGNEQIKLINQLMAELLTEQQKPNKTSADSHLITARLTELNASLKKAMALNALYEEEQKTINSQFDETIKQYRAIITERQASGR